MKHLLNICNINGAEVEPVDIITFGAPCQDLSVAGKRSGLKHEVLGDNETTRSGLFFEAIRIIKEMRESTNGEYPKYAVYENVPGAFSSNKGRDFHAVLEALCSVCDDTVSIPEPERDGKTDNLIWLSAGSIVGNGWSIAWRTLDAQYWGVPQRRKRIYLVADFTGRRAGEILFKPDSLRGDMSQGNEAGQEVAANALGGVDGSSGVVGIDGYNFSITGDKAATVGVNCGMSTGRNGVIESVDGSSGNGGQLAATVISSYGTKWNGNAGAYNGENFVLQKPGIDGSVGAAGFLSTQGSKAMGIGFAMEQSPTLRAGLSGADVIILNDQGGSSINVEQEETSPTLRANSHQHEPVIAFEPGAMVRDMGNRIWAEQSPTLRANMGDNQPVIAFSQNQREEVRDLGDKAGALAAEAGAHQQTYVAQPVIALQANGIDRADTAGCNGCGWRENESYTLNTIDRHAGCYGIDQQGGKGGANFAENTMPPMCSDSHGTPHAVCYQESVGALQARDYKGVGNQYVGEEKLIIECYDARGNGDGETACTITGDHQNRITDYTAVAVQKTLSGEDVSGCLKARDYKGCEYLNETLSKCVIQTAKPPRKYIIRRLTPTECARLQGFPSWWSTLAPYNPADAEFWEDVRKTHAEINGKKYKPVKDIKKWYDKLHTDSAEYKMWGNGIALPNAEYVIRGIAEQGAKTLGSLFDGSGGFPLAGAMNGIKPLWASEIEPYPIAVTKSRFKEE